MATTKTLLQLDQLLLEAISDYISVATTTQADYTTGTALFTNASAAVVGTSTVWSASHVGSQIKNDTNGTWYVISAVTDATHLTLTAVYAGATTPSEAYTIRTHIAANNYIFSTNLNAYDMARDDIFNNWWVYLNTTNNASVDRKVKDYTTSTGRLEVYGAALVAETTAVTIRLSRYSWADRANAIIRAVEEIYPALHLKLEDRTLVTGNILPNSHFEDWAVTTAPDKYSMIDSNITATALTTAGFIRGGAKSMNAVTGAGGADKYVYISSKTHPRLLDLMGKTIDFKCWVYPESANDAWIQIYTVKADGTKQYLPEDYADEQSTAGFSYAAIAPTAPATAWTLLEAENQTLNDDLVEVQLRFGIHTASKYVYFDAARVTGRDLYEYILPTDFQVGNITQVDIQDSGYSDDICDDLHPTSWEEVYGWEIINDGTDIWLKLPYLYSNKRQIRLIGRKKLETLVATTDSGTITLDKEERVNVLIAYAAYRLFKMVKGLPASADIERYDNLANEWLGNYYRLSSQLKMGTGPVRMHLPAI